MKCPNCAAEMEAGYILQLGFSGIIRIAKDKDNLSSGKVSVSVCPNCGKIEAFVDHATIK